MVMEPLEFNWQISQPALVAGYYTSANGVGLTTRPDTYGFYSLVAIKRQPHRRPELGQSVGMKFLGKLFFR